MPVLTRSREAMERAFKQPHSVGDENKHKLLTPTSLSPASSTYKSLISKPVCTAGGKRLRATADRKRSTCSWDCRYRTDLKDKRAKARAADQVHKFLSRPISFAQSFYFPYMHELDLRHPLAKPFLSAKQPLSMDHVDLLARMVRLFARDTANTVFIAYSLLCRYLAVVRRRVSMAAASVHGLLCAAALLAFKLAEEVDLEVEPCIHALSLQCTRQHVLGYERKIAAALSWQLIGPPTPDEAAHALLDCLFAGDEGMSMEAKTLLIGCVGDPVSEFFYSRPVDAHSVVQATLAALHALFTALCPSCLVDWNECMIENDLLEHFECKFKQYSSQ